MTFEASFTQYLLDDAGIAGAVDDRIYPVRIPEKYSLPLITWTRVSTSREYTYGSFGDDEPFAVARIQVNCWAYTAELAMDIGDAVLAALSGYDGTFSGELVAGEMQAAFADNDFSTYEAPTKHHRRILDFFVYYEDAVVGS